MNEMNTSTRGCRETYFELVFVCVRAELTQLCFLQNSSRNIFRRFLRLPLFCSVLVRLMHASMNDNMDLVFICVCPDTLIHWFRPRSICCCRFVFFLFVELCSVSFYCLRSERVRVFVFTIFPSRITGLKPHSNIWVEFFHSIDEACSVTEKK